MQRTCSYDTKSSILDFQCSQCKLRILTNDSDRRDRINRIAKIVVLTSALLFYHLNLQCDHCKTNCFRTKILEKYFRTKRTFCRKKIDS